MNNKTSLNGFSAAIAQKIADYKLLVKLGLSNLVVFSAGIAFLMGQDKSIDWGGLMLLCVGGYLVTWAANALNQVIEKDYDKLMTRTAVRPLATGRMETTEAVLAAGLMSVAGILVFAIFFNPLTAFLAVISLLSYAFVYTPMKRVSPVSVWIGAIPGALPMMIGYAAATGSVGLVGWILFTIQFLWQFPHFWAIGWVGYEDYQKGGFKMLPSVNGRDRETALQCVIYAFALLPASVLPYWSGMSGIWSLVVLSVMAIFYTYKAIVLYLKLDNASARSLMFASFFYLPIVLLALLFL